MFFSKKPEQATPARVETLEWEKGGRRTQSTRIIVTYWFVKTVPMLQYPGGHKTQFTFEGVARLGTTPSVPVYGDIEVVDDPESPRFLRDCWKTVPESIEGYASMSSDRDSVRVPRLHITLYCTAAASEWVARVFAAGFSSVEGKTALDVDFTYPDEIGPEFWKQQWQTSTVEVAKWDVRASAGSPSEG